VLLEELEGIGRQNPEGAFCFAHPADQYLAELPQILQVSIASHPE
jgi:hypothetical protein